MCLIVKTAICTFCAQTGMLCKDCQQKLNEGEITETDVEIAKVALEFEKKHPAASKVHILETIERPDQIIILVAPGHKRFLTGGKLDFDKQVEQRLKKPVKIIEKMKDARKTIDALFAPAIISGINTVFVPLRSSKPGGSSIEEEMIIVLAPSEKEKVPGTIKEMKALVKELTGEEVRIVFR